MVMVIRLMYKYEDLKNPIQPLYKTESGTIRFKPNAIVQYLLDNGGLDMNDIAINCHDTSDDDKKQFAQLIGYSLSGYEELSYVDAHNDAKQMNSDMELLCLINSIKGRMKQMTDEHRSELIYELNEGYCRHCGSDLPCYCRYDD